MEEGTTDEVMEIFLSFFDGLPCRRDMHGDQATMRALVSMPAWTPLVLMLMA